MWNPPAVIGNPRHGQFMQFRQFDKAMCTWGDRPNSTTTPPLELHWSIKKQTSKNVQNTT